MNPNVVVKSLSSRQGDGLQFPDVLVTDALTGAPIDLTSCNVYVTVKRTLTDQQTAAVAKFKTGDATTYFTVTIASPSSGHIAIQAHAAATSSLSVGVTYQLQYDVKVDSGPGTDPQTVMYGTWTVAPSVTTT